MIVTGDPVVAWVARRTNEFGNFGCATGIGVERDGSLIAGVAYNDFNGVNCCMHVAALPGRRWLSRGLLWMLFDYPFRQLGLRRVTAPIGEGNTRARKFVTDVGFVLETQLKQAHPTGDLLVFVMTKEACRWISPDTSLPLAKAA